MPLRRATTFVAMMVAFGCSPMGPEDREYNIFGTAPTAVAEVHAAADRWFTAEIDAVTRASTLIEGSDPLTVGRRARISITLLPQGAATAYRIHGHTEVLDAGTWRQADENDDRVVALVKSLDTALSCAVAKWSGCP